MTVEEGVAKLSAGERWRKRLRIGKGRVLTGQE